MQVIKGTTDFSIDGVSSVTLGKFDGVHRGHRALMDRVCAYAEESPKKPVRAVFSLLIAQKMLLTRSERRTVIEETGMDVLIECPFGKSVMNMEAEDFVRKILRDRLHAVHVVRRASPSRSCRRYRMKAEISPAQGSAGRWHREIWSG